GQGDIVGRSGYFSLNLSANSVMRGRLDARRTLKSLVADLRVYYFESTLSPDIFWVDFKSLDFKAGTPIKKLTLTDGEIYAGNTAKDFKDSKPLPFLFGI
ncbi:hypothetical protein NBH16_22790, partial [Parabacteroides sp. Y3-G-102]|nr:hypothetical protein [Parabacteroides sp. Y3-G-102]